MSESKKATTFNYKNPLIWISVLVVGLITCLLLSGERRASMPIISLATVEKKDDVAIEHSILSTPGVRAREFIKQLRTEGKPYPFDRIYVKAQSFLRQGNLADAHLLYFFAAREDHLPSIMMMGEMSDPRFFRAENSLLDHADVIQAYKWYQKAAILGDQAAVQRVADLKQWAHVQAEVGNSDARQLLLNFN